MNVLTQASRGLECGILACCIVFSAEALGSNAVLVLDGRDNTRYEIDESESSISLRIDRVPEGSPRLFVAFGVSGHTGSRIVPFDRTYEGSSVFLPFNASSILSVGTDDVTLRRWSGTVWNQRAAAGPGVLVKRIPGRLEVILDRTKLNLTGPWRLVAYFRDFSERSEWGVLKGSLDKSEPGGVGDLVLRRYVESNGKQLSLVSNPSGADRRVKIYQFLPRHFGNTNESRKRNGTIEENGCGKFSDINERSLAELKAMGFTHLWPTGVLQQATATDYSAIGEPADDPDLLKGLAGSPYAIRDYYDVSPDYADDPARRIVEFQAVVKRIHDAGLQVIIDFVPNHVARSYRSSVRPEATFGQNDERTVYFSASNNFFWLTPEAKPHGNGPPLRLPTVDGAGYPISPTVKVSKVPGDGLFEAETTHGRVTGSNLASWEPDMGSWYETVKLNYGYDFLDPRKRTRLYPHGDEVDVEIPDTWRKMDDIIAYWQGLGVDGFRVDMAHMVPPEFWHWMIARARGRDSDVFFMAEAYDTDPAKVPSGDPLVAQVGNGNVMFDLLNAGFDAVYDDATYDKLKEVYEKSAWANDLDRQMAPPFVFQNSLRYAENHDEVRLAGKDVWGGVGPRVGRPVTALLFGLSRGPVMLYSGQEVGEPANGSEGFGDDDARTSIFDYWSMPEFAKWVNGGLFDGGRLSKEQKGLREFYARLLTVIGQPAFRNGGFVPLNPTNLNNPAYGRLPGESASGRWLYAFLRQDEESGQAFLVVVNLHPDQSLGPIRILLPRDLMNRVSGGMGFRLVDRLGGQGTVISTPDEAAEGGAAIGTLGPLSVAMFEVVPTTAGGIR